MKKRVLAVLLALALLKSLLPASALATDPAAEPKTVEAPETESSEADDADEADEAESSESETVEGETIWMDPELLEDLPDNDTLFLGYAWQTLYGGEVAAG